MRQFIFNPAKTKEFNFNSLKFPKITITKIKTSNFEDLKQVFIIKTIVGNGYHQQPYVLNAYISPYTLSPEIEVEFPVTELPQTILYAETIIDTDYIIYYETFEDKINKIKDNKLKDKDKVEKRIEEWQRAINEIYKQITSTVEPYKDVKLVETEAIITEELTGPYNVQNLVLSIFNYNIIFIPIGTFLLGAHGRIDIKVMGKLTDSLMLILNKDNENNDVWKLVKNRNQFSAVVFNESQIIKLLEYVIED